jgi:hypothetical protein
MPDTTDSTNFYLLFFSSTYMPMIELNLHIRHSKRITIKQNNYSNIIKVFKTCQQFTSGIFHLIVFYHNNCG